MRHLHTGRKLGVDASHRTALLRSLALALIEQESIQTTTARAKELRWWADRIVTLAKRGDVHGRRTIVKLLGATETKVPGENRVRLAVERVYSDLVPRFRSRPGGYTQIFHLAKRRAGDNAEMVVMRYIPGEEEPKTAKKGGKAEKETKADKGKKAEAKAEKPSKKEAKAAPPKAEKAEKKTSKKAPEDKPAKAKKKDKE